HDLGSRRGRDQGPPRDRSVAREVLLGRRVPRPRHPRHLRRRASLAPFRLGAADRSSACARRVGTGLGPWSPRPGSPRGSLVAATGLAAGVAVPVRAQAPRATEIAAGATVVLAHRGFWGPEVGVARRSGGQGRLTFGAACGSYERALGVRLGASAQFLLRPG